MTELIEANGVKQGGNRGWERVMDLSAPAFLNAY
jgi:hypothetical protein